MGIPPTLDAAVPHSIRGNNAELCGKPAPAACLVPMPTRLLRGNVAVMNSPQPERPSTPLHVLPDRVGGWRVVREGEDQPLSEHNSETDAEGAAVSEARATDTSEVVVHDRYDRVHPADC